MTFIFLWKNREKPITFKRWLVVWVKRVLLFFPLVKLLYKPVKFKCAGATIGAVVNLGKITTHGPLSNLSIGNHSSLGRCEIALHDKVTIGNNVVINDGVLLLTASHRLDDPLWQHKKSPIQIDDFAWIASNSIILPGVKIGRGAVVGAGAVIRKDVPAYSVAIGNPAIILKEKRVEDLSYSPALFNAPFEAWVGKIKFNCKLLRKNYE